MSDRMHLDPDDVKIPPVNETMQDRFNVMLQLERLREEKEAWRLVAMREHELRSSTPLVPPKRCPSCGHYEHACQC